MKKITLLTFFLSGTLFFNFASAQCVANGTLTPTGTPGEFTITDLSTSSGTSPVSYFSSTQSSTSGYSNLWLQPVSTTGTFQYSENGTFPYTFFVYDSISGCQDAMTGTVTVTGINTSQPCQAAFTILQDSTNPGIFWCWNNSVGGSPALGLSYLWDFGDGTTSTLAYPTHTYNGLGFYPICLTVIDSGSTIMCTSTICDTILVSVKASGTTLNVLPPGASASVDELSSISNLTTFPNPTDGNFTLEMTAKKEGQATISLINLAGQILESNVYAVQTGSNTIQFNTNEMNAGIYFVQIADGATGSTQTVRMVKK